MEFPPCAHGNREGGRGMTSAIRVIAQIFKAFSEKLNIMVGTADGPKNWVSQCILISVSVHFSILWDMEGLFYPPPPVPPALCKYQRENAEVTK